MIIVGILFMLVQIFLIEIVNFTGHKLFLLETTIQGARGTILTQVAFMLKPRTTQRNFVF